MSPTVLVCLAHGSEEIEAVTVIDLLTRAEIPVTTASTEDNGELVLTCSRGVKIVANTQLVNIIDQDFAASVLPGGLKGAEAFRDNPLIIEKIRQSHHQGKIIAALCAVPAIVLEHHNLFPIGNMTGYPALQNKIASHKRVDYRVYYDERAKLLTSQGPATAIDFSLKLIELLVGKKKVAEVASQLVLPPGIYNYAN
ncbi:oxidative-stress-resistance chaperone [Arsenophonus endosymbiont of Bemisia tabaci Asia II 3]|nr:oxidative-stress-resistance chaperone [Arsenophonus endosymbiont of Bemisia tabaci Asia II 3]